MSTEERKQGKKFPRQFEIAVVKASSQAKKVAHLKCADTRRQIVVFAGPANAQKCCCLHFARSRDLAAAANSGKTWKTVMVDTCRKETQKQRMTAILSA